MAELNLQDALAANLQAHLRQVQGQQGGGVNVSQAQAALPAPEAAVNHEDEDSDSDPPPAKAKRIAKSVNWSDCETMNMMLATLDHEQHHENLPSKEAKDVLKDIAERTMENTARDLQSTNPSKGNYYLYTYIIYHEHSINILFLHFACCFI
jgi:hypothetical protein